MVTEILYYKSNATGELGNPQRIGETEYGEATYQFVEGYTPVDKDGNEIPDLESDEFGDWFVPDRHERRMRKDRLIMNKPGFYTESFDTYYLTPRGRAWIVGPDGVREAEEIPSGATKLGGIWDGEELVKLVKYLRLIEKESGEGLPWLG